MTIDEIDAAIARALAIPEPSRGQGWTAMVDSLLDQRAQAGQQGRHAPPKTTRIVHASETRA